MAEKDELEQQQTIEQASAHLNKPNDPFVDDVLAEVDLDRKQAFMKKTKRIDLWPDAPIPTVKKEDVKEAAKMGIIKGSFAISQTPMLTPILKKKKDFADEVLDESGFTLTGSRNSPIHIIDNLEATDAAAKRPKDFVDQVLGEVETDKQGFGVRAYEPKSGQSLSGLGKTALTALSIGEHATVSALAHLTGVPRKNDFSEYTYTNLLKDWGAPDDIATDAVGMAMGIFLDPTTYLSFGTTGVAKIGKVLGREITLTKKGLTMANEVSKARTAVMTGELEVKFGRELTNKEVSELALKNKSKVESELVDKFKVFIDDTEKIRLSGDVGKMPNTVFDMGGIKFAGKTIMRGEEVVRVLDQAGLLKYMEKIKDTAVGGAVGTALGAAVTGGSLGGEIIGGIAGASLQADAKITRRLLNKLFVRTGGLPHEVITLYDETMAQANRDKFQALEYAEKFFQGLSKEQKKLFSDEAIGASQMTEKVSGFGHVTDRSVQERLDRWFGTGQHQGKKSIGDELKEKSGLIEDEGLANWFPGIDDRIKLSNITLPREIGAADRKYLNERMGNPDNYTRDPVQALSIRMTQVAYANLQDDLYKKVIAKGKDLDVRSLADFGGDLSKAARQGYVVFREPVLKDLVPGSESFIKRTANETYLVRPDFKEKFEGLVKEKEFRLPFLSYANDIFKAGVTTLFPAFHARNFASNIVFNSYNIGGHAIPLLSGGKFSRATDMVTGKNLDKLFVTDIGEKYTTRELIQEASEQGLIANMFYDIGGDNLNGAAKGIWSNMFSKSNPLSVDFVPYMWGRKLGNAIETQAKMVNYLAWREKGLSPLMAAAEAKRALFDYSAITHFEKQWANNIIPFYTFRKKNFEKHMNFLMTEPGKVSASLKAIRDLGPSDKDWDGIQDYQKNKLSLRFKEMILSGFGLPMEDVLSTLDLVGLQGLAALSPLLRVPIEKAIDKDFYSQRPLASLNHAREFSWVLNIIHSDKAPGFLKEAVRPIKNFLELQRHPEQGYVIGDPDKLHVMRSLPSSRFQSMIGFMEQQAVKDRSGFETAARALFGVIKIEKSVEKKEVIERLKSAQRVRRAAVSSNVAKEIPVITGLDPDNNAEIQEFMEDVLGSDFTREREINEKAAIKSIKQLQKEAVGK